MNIHQFDTQVQKYKLEFTEVKKVETINTYNYLARGEKLYMISIYDFPDSKAIIYLFEDNALYQKIKQDLVNLNFKFNGTLDNANFINFQYSKGNTRIGLNSMALPKSGSDGVIRIVYAIEITHN